MKREKISEIIGLIDEKYTEEAAMTDAAEAVGAVEPPRKRGVLMRWCAVAASVLIVASAGITTVACVEEAKEYGTAITFFEENGISTVGLTRSEVKAVYRDIISHSFTYEKTEVVLRRTIPGSEILQDDPTPTELGQVWASNSAMNASRNVITVSGYGYKYNHVYDESEDWYHIKDEISCYNNGELIWSAELPRAFITDCKHLDAGTAVWGRGYTSMGVLTYAWIALIDDNGTLLWKHSMLDHWYGTEMIFSVVDNGDGTWAVFSRGANANKDNYLCISIYDTAGNELKCSKNKVGNEYYQNAARLGDGYLLQIGVFPAAYTEKFVKIDAEGNITGSFALEEDGYYYNVQDIVEFGGRTYISAYVFPVPSKGSMFSSRDEVYDILQGIYGTYEPSEIPDEAIAYKGLYTDFTEPPSGFGFLGNLTAKLRDNYTAVLLICDSDGGTPETFYSVKGSLGAKLAVRSNGTLEWNVSSIVSSSFSPATSSFTIGVTCSVYRYTFDGSGDLLGSVGTGAFTSFVR